MAHPFHGLLEAALSTADCKYIAMADDMSSAAVLNENLRRLQLIAPEPVPLFVDKEPAVFMINSLGWTKLRKNIRLRHHYLRNVTTGVLVGVRHNPGQQRKVDIMTKAVDSIAFLRARQLLSMAPPSDIFHENSGECILVMQCAQTLFHH